MYRSAALRPDPFEPLSEKASSVGDFFARARASAFFFADANFFFADANARARF